MTQPRDNYQIQLGQAKRRFLTYDQQELIRRCRLRHDADYFYTRFLSEEYRIHRRSGDMERFHRGSWIDGNSFAEVMTVLDWLCDSKLNRYITNKWINIINQGLSFHRSLQEDGPDPNAEYFDKKPEAFIAACLALQGEPAASADIGFTIELVDGLRILVQLWHGDQEFSPRLRCLWDENTTRYIRYETTWYATGLLMQRIRENM